jgi:hypothetical protein
MHIGAASPDGDLNPAFDLAGLRFGMILSEYRLRASGMSLNRLT